MKTLILALLTLSSSNAFAYGKLLSCDAIGTLKKKQLFSIHADVWDARVNTQDTVYEHHTRKGVDRTSLAISSLDRFTDHFTVRLQVVRGGKVIESSVLADQSLREGLESYSLEKENVPVKHYQMKLVCKRVND